MEARIKMEEHYRPQEILKPEFVESFQERRRREGSKLESKFIDALNSSYQDKHYTKLTYLGGEGFVVSGENESFSGIIDDLVLTYVGSPVRVERELKDSVLELYNQEGFKVHNDIGIIEPSQNKFLEIAIGLGRSTAASRGTEHTVHLSVTYGGIMRLENGRPITYWDLPKDERDAIDELDFACLKDPLDNSNEEK